MLLTQARFEQLVFETAEEALNRLPMDLRLAAGRVVLSVEAEPPDGEPDLLGLFEGVPLTERGPDDVFLEPDRITLFSHPLLEMCADEAELRTEIRITLIHEYAHFFGMEEDELTRRGWG
ncbi:MAG: metallopeptidase family protein [Anaerolineales bacterium]|nr:metallopeptidase family protein [Anaerolineales bacterium]